MGRHGAATAEVYRHAFSADTLAAEMFFRQGGQPLAGGAQPQIGRVDDAFVESGTPRGVSSEMMTAMQQLLEKRRSVALAKQELEHTREVSILDETSSRPRLSAAVGYTASNVPVGTGQYAEGEIAGMGMLAAERSKHLKATRSHLDDFISYAEQLLLLKAPIKLSVNVMPVGSTLNDLINDAITCIAYGPQRHISSNATIEVISAAIDEIDVEIWDGEATHLIGQASVSIMGLLTNGKGVIEEQLAVGVPGNAPVGSVKVRVEAREK